MAEEQVYKKASGFFPTPDGKTIEIRDVWASNLAEEMSHIREILEKFPYVAMVCAIRLYLLLPLLLFLSHVAIQCVLARVLLASLPHFSLSDLFI